jgi:hypothetical protein
VSCNDINASAIYGSGDLTVGMSFTAYSATGDISCGAITSGDVSCGYINCVLSYYGGGSYVVYSGGNLYYGGMVSARRFKQNIRPLENVTEKVKQLEPKRFEMIRNPTKDQIGLIAEEVFEIFPEFIKYKDGEIHTVDYKLLSVVAIKEIKELYNRIETIESENSTLKNQMQDLISRIESLEQS